MNSDCADTDDGYLALAFFSLRFLSASQILIYSIYGQKGGYDGYSKCHYHSTNHVTAIRPVLHVDVFLVS